MALDILSSLIFPSLSKIWEYLRVVSMFLCPSNCCVSVRLPPFRRFNVAAVCLREWAVSLSEMYPAVTMLFLAILDIDLVVILPFWFLWSREANRGLSGFFSPLAVK